MVEAIANTNDVRAVLSDELLMLRKGDVAPQRVNAVCNLVGKILQSARLDIEYERMQRPKQPSSYELRNPKALKLEKK